MYIQIMGDMTGNMDAKKALHEALKIHKKYIKVSFSSVFPLCIASDFQTSYTCTPCMQAKKT